MLKIMLKNVKNYIQKQKIYTKHGWNVENNVKLCLDIKNGRDWTDTPVPCERELRTNVIQSFATSCHVQSYQDSKSEH